MTTKDRSIYPFQSNVIRKERLTRRQKEAARRVSANVPGKCPDFDIACWTRWLEFVVCSSDVFSDWICWFSRFSGTLRRSFAFWHTESAETWSSRSFIYCLRACTKSDPVLRFFLDPSDVRSGQNSSRWTVATGSNPHQSMVKSCNIHHVKSRPTGIPNCSYC